MNPQLIRRCLLPAFVAVLLQALSARGDTVIQPLSIDGYYDLSLLPHYEARTAQVDLGITFAQISSVELRLNAFATPGLARVLGTSHVDDFPPLVTATLLGDDQSTAAFGEILYSTDTDSLLALDKNWPPAAPDYSPLLDGKSFLSFSVDVPLMTAHTAIEDYPTMQVNASALVVSGETSGRLTGDFDGDGAVFVEDHEFFKRTFGQHVRPGTGADASGNGVVDVADYVYWRNHLGNSIRPTDGYLLGDFDYSGAVDGADYNFWRVRFGQAAAPFSGADGNGDGFVNAADYRVWRDQLGSSLPEYSQLAAPVPEPTTLLLTISVAITFLMVSRRRD